HASFWGLRESILAVQRATALNFPLWEANPGGYVGRPTRELFARWLAFSCFSPLMDLGPLGNLAPWAWAPDGVPAPVGYGFRPYWDEELVVLPASCSRLRQDLVDYLYAQAEEAHRMGLPRVRPTALAYPEEQGLRRWDQHLLGPDLLVCPVWEEGPSGCAFAFRRGVGTTPGRGGPMRARRSRRWTYRFTGSPCGSGRARPWGRR
ncbi:MAG: TIM-barrel domain-containing protein, partial [Candidatus Bipolaricaulaceae bacterium]